MVETGCYLCGASGAIVLFEQRFPDPYLALVNPDLNDHTRYWKVCRDCGFIYRSPRLAVAEQETLYANYGNNVFKKESPDAYFDRLSGLPPFESENHAKAAWLFERHAELTGGMKDPMSVLDVGCGAGLLMHKSKEFRPALDLHGVEPNRDYAELARRRAGAFVRTGDYRDGLFGRRFDLVICTKVLEHVMDPRGFLAHIASDLKETGILFLEVPDVSDVFLLPPDHERFYIPHHYFFTMATLGVLLAERGLGISASHSVRTRPDRAYLRILAGKTAQPPSFRKPYDDPSEIVRHRRSARGPEPQALT